MHERAITSLGSAQGSATDQVFDALYAAVVTVQLPPGTKMSVDEISKQMNVSRQPARDAFFRLANLGFLSIRPQRATLITQISEEAVLDAVFTRSALELACLRAAMERMTDEGIAGLRRNLTLQELALAGEAAEFHALDEAFHAAICHLSGHRHVWALIREQKGHLDRIRYITLSEQRRHHVLGEHLAIVEAMEAGKPKRAERALRAHLDGVKAVLPGLRAKHPSYFEPVQPSGQSG